MRKLFWGGALLAVVSAGVILYSFSPAEYGFYPFCVFHELTGWHCPGCGGTRALYQLLHGHVWAALRLNALLVLSLPLFAGWVVRVGRDRFQRRPVRRRFSSGWFWWYLALGVGFGVLRNLPAFAWLAP